MQVEEGVFLRKKWGNKYCEHKNIVQEYFLGTKTTDFICTKCGSLFSKAEKESFEANKEIQSL